MSDQPIVDELDRPIDVERTLDQAPPRDPDAGAPPSLADLPQGLWPLHLATHPRLLSAAGRSERSQRLADYLLAESGHRSGPLKSILAGEAGRILIQELGQQFQGQAIIRDSGSEVPSLMISAAREPFFDLSAALEELAAQAGDGARAPAERAAAWIEHGLLCEERAGEPERALASYRAALDTVADHPVARDLAAQTAALLGRADEARAHLAALAAAAAPSGPLAGAYRLEEAALADDPGERRTILEAASAGEAPQPTALRRLLPLVRAAGEVGHLSSLYRRYATVAGDSIAAGTALHQALTALGESPISADATLAAIRAWLDRHGDDIAAFPLLAEIVRTVEQQDLSDPSAVDESGYVDLLERLYPFVDDLHEQAVIREQLARLRWAALQAERPDPPTADDVLVGPPPLADEVARRYQQLIDDLRFCLAHQPEQRWIRDTLGAALRDLRDVDALVDHLEEWALIHSAGPGRAAVLMRLGGVHEELRRDLAMAAEIYELAVAEDPSNPSCLRALGSIYERMQRWPQAIDTLQRQAKATADPPDRLAALRRVATLAEHEIGDIDLAIETLREIAELDADDILSLYQLAALCRAHERHHDLLSALELLVDRLEDNAARTATLFEIGDAQERALSDVDAARISYERALECSPGYSPALRALARIYRDRGDYEALLGLHDPKVDTITDPAVLSLKAARICLEEISDMDRAIEHLFASYEQNPDLAPTRELLVQLLRASGRVRECYDLLRAQDLPNGEALLADYNYRLGRLAEELAASDPTDARPEIDRDRALQHYRAALAIQPDHGLAFEHARRLLVSAGDVANLIRLLEDQLGHLQGNARASLQIQLARLHLARPEGQATARSYYEGAVESAPDDAMIRREYENLLRQTDDTKGLPTIRLALARISEDTHYKATLLVESAEALLTSGAIEDREFAANAILGALREDPGNPYAVRQLEGLLSDPRSPVAMTDAVGARAVRAQSDSERAIFYLESAELLERAGADNEATRAYRAALRAMPGLAPAEMGLTRIASGGQRSEATPQTKAVSIHTLMADARDAAVRAGTSGDPKDAEEALNLLGQILGRDPHYRDALGLTRALVSQLQDPTPAINLLSTVFGRITDGALRYELGVFLGEQSTSDEDALAYFQVAADARADGKQALRGLLRRHQRLGNEEASAEIMERLLALYDPGEPSAIDLRLTLANYLARSPSTLDRALEHARIVLQARSDDPRALLLMAELLERSQLPSEAVEMLERLINRERDADRLHELHTRRARLLAELPGREGDALAAAERAAELNPGNRATILLLIRLLDRTGQTTRVSAFLEPIRNAMLANIGRGQVSPNDLKLLAEVAQGTNPALAGMARLLGYAIEPTSVPPPEGHMQAATLDGLQRLLATPTLRTAVLSPLESPDLNDLLTCIETAIERSYTEFTGLRPEDLVPLPPNVAASTITPRLDRWGALLGCNPLLLGATTTNNASVLFEEGSESSLRLGINLWLRGDEVAWRGLAALALARKALGGVMVRALTAEELDLALAASFETAKVFNAITADPDSRRLRELSAIFVKQLGRRQRKTLLRVCHSLASTNFEPTTTARGTLASDLRMAAILSGDVSGCLSAACLLDGFANGSLKQRISFSRNAQELAVFLLSDAFLGLREVALT
ncbi:MAG: tetratricopeptide repeat protein [Myxococcales bacterium]|nr:tetratricopeptide repeat protein [Myxococcales bacterium]